MLTISANPELLELELEELPDPPRPPAELAPLPLADEPDEDEVPVPLEPDGVDDPEPAETGSPGLRFCNETIVPALGATRRVSASVVRALRRLASAPSTAACADAIAAGDGVLVVVVWLGVVRAVAEFDRVVPADPGALDGGLALEPALGVVGGLAFVDGRLGVVVVGRLGVVVVGGRVGEVVLGAVPVVMVVELVWPANPTRAETNSVTAAAVVPALAADAPPLVPEDPEPAEEEEEDVPFSAEVS